MLLVAQRWKKQIQDVPDEDQRVRVSDERHDLTDCDDVWNSTEIQIGIDPYHDASESRVFCLSVIDYQGRR